MEESALDSSNVGAHIYALYRHRSSATANAAHFRPRAAPQFGVERRARVQLRRRAKSQSRDKRSSGCAFALLVAPALLAPSRRLANKPGGGGGGGSSARLMKSLRANQVQRLAIARKKLRANIGARVGALASGGRMIDRANDNHADWRTRRPASKRANEGRSEKKSVSQARRRTKSRSACSEALEQLVFARRKWAIVVWARRVGFALLFLLAGLLACFLAKSSAWPEAALSIIGRRLTSGA